MRHAARSSHQFAAQEARRLAELLDNRRVASWPVLEKYFRPGRYCVAGFGARGIAVERRIYLQTFFKGKDRPRLWRFPNDPSLLRVATVLQNAKAQHESVDVLHYVPLNRCTLRVGDGRGGVRVGKLDVSGHSANLYDWLRLIWRRQSSEYTIAEPLAYEASKGLLWQSWCDGTSFVAQALRTSLADACRRVAVGLAALHREEWPGVNGSKQISLAAKVLARARSLADCFPTLAPDLLKLAARTAAALSRLSPAASVLSHGDFNYSQVLFDGGRPIFLDFTARFAEPTCDPAHFIAALYDPALARDHRLTSDPNAAREFWQSYRRQVPWHIGEPRLHAHIAALMITRRAHKVLTHLEVDAEAQVARFIGLGFKHLEGRISYE